MQYPALDIGSGGGVPGLLAALLDERDWVVSDSEKSKADYLSRAAEGLGLVPRVQVVAGRAEVYLKDHQVPTVIARAVGPVERIYSWIRNCSTWNNMILFKGPGWEQEWEAFQKGRWKKELVIDSIHRYQVGPEQKDRRLVLISRTKRPV
jgi:16S rRNA (guanine527-N7)-methyltransferase